MSFMFDNIVDQLAFAVSILRCGICRDRGRPRSQRTMLQEQPPEQHVFPSIAVSRLPGMDERIDIVDDQEARLSSILPHAEDVPKCFGQDEKDEENILSDRRALSSVAVQTDEADIHRGGQIPSSVGQQSASAAVNMFSNASNITLSQSNIYICVHAHHAHVEG
ncbi:hypothetical protein CPB83DRAFT_838137 [Crepidotus variabilis]|uniref:Uncharacterized protein n=1 Tax=Crepidotus variabilis TaxID=179855 RepID=A0A9P6EAM7_9AGAR|nr:hypothetical protein CPB83DRAFT_840977 [Crepidotus variabilis]KAF9525554.1 hypothetical protein CPB83DRAFT_838137 [Crepidotus variabilis]